MKIEENREKSRCKNDVFFDCLFLLILEGFGEDFGMVLGGVWSLLVPLGALFFNHLGLPTFSNIT